MDRLPLEHVWSDARVRRRSEQDVTGVNKRVERGQCPGRRGPAASWIVFPHCSMADGIVKSARDRSREKFAAIPPKVFERILLIQILFGRFANVSQVVGVM